MHACSVYMWLGMEMGGLGEVVVEPGFFSNSIFAQ
jgi:hypothetical protein